MKLLAIAMLVMGVFGPIDDETTLTKEDLVGTWDVISVQDSGVYANPKEIAGSKINFGKDVAELVGFPSEVKGTSLKGNYTTGRPETPGQDAQLEILFEPGTPGAGILEAAFRLEGDILKLCMTRGVDRLATKVEATVDTIVFTLQRQSAASLLAGEWTVESFAEDGDIAEVYAGRRVRIETYGRSLAFRWNMSESPDDWDQELTRFYKLPAGHANWIDEDRTGLKGIYTQDEDRVVFVFAEVRPNNVVDIRRGTRLVLKRAPAKKD